MSEIVMVWDIETIADLKGFAVANSLHDTIIPGNEWDDAA